jgi:hypothetical protein
VLGRERECRMIGLWSSAAAAALLDLFAILFNWIHSQRRSDRHGPETRVPAARQILSTGIQ